MASKEQEAADSTASSVTEQTESTESKTVENAELIKFSIGVLGEHLVAQFPQGYVFHDGTKAEKAVEFYAYRCMFHTKEERKKDKLGITPSRSSIDNNETIVDLITPWIPVLEENWNGADKALGHFDEEPRSQIRGSVAKDNKKHLRFKFWQLYIYLGDIRDPDRSNNDHTILGVWEKIVVDVPPAYPLTEDKLTSPPVVVGP